MAFTRDPFITHSGPNRGPWGLDWSRISDDLTKMERALTSPVPTPPANTVTVTLTGKAGEPMRHFGWFATYLRKLLNVPNPVKEMTATVQLPKPVPVPPPCAAPLTEIGRRRAAVLDAAELLTACRERLTDDGTLDAMLKDYLADNGIFNGVNTSALRAEQKKITLRIRQDELAKVNAQVERVKKEVKRAEYAVKGKQYIDKDEVDF